MKFKQFAETFGCITERCHGGNVGDPIQLIPWQWEEIIKPLYGWRKADGSKRFTEVGLWVPKKNNKSGLVSLLSLFHAMVEEPAANCLVLASKVDQAKVCFNFAANTCRYGKLRSRLGKNSLWIRDNVSEIRWTNKAGIRSVIKIMPTTPEISGPSASQVVYDELAEWGGTHARTIYDRLAGATAARGGLHVVLSTPQFDLTHLGYERYSYAKRVLDGDIIDPSFLPVIYGIPQDASCICGKCEGLKEAWRCPEWWWKANPSVGITVPKSFYYEKYQKVQNNPIEEAAWRTLHCGQWVGHSEQWVASNVWADCKEDFKEESLHGLPCYVGIDSARRYDLASYVIAVPKDDKVYLLPRFFMPRANALKKAEIDRVPYDRWESQGYITLTDGDVINPQILREHLLKDLANFEALEVRYDPYGFEESRQILEYDHGLPMVEVKQSANNMSPPTAHLERLILDGRLRHSGHPILTWCLGNCTTRTIDNQYVMIDKRRSTGRTDGITASIIAISGILADEGGWDMMPTLL